jgi:hypothetical protein
LTRIGPTLYRPAARNQPQGFAVVSTGFQLSAVQIRKQQFGVPREDLYFTRARTAPVLAAEDTAVFIHYIFTASTALLVISRVMKVWPVLPIFA